MSRAAGRAAREPALRVAAEAYYWKPATAWFRALELAQYESLDAPLRGRVLDLGCGDGRVAWMLERLGRLGPEPTGTDVSPHQLRLAGRLGVHGELVRSDATRLPFASRAFRSVLCNGVICSIPGDFRPAVREIRRVLAPGGRAVITVPTDRFQEVLLWPRVLGRVSAWMRERYERAMDARQPHYRALSPEDWRRELEDAGLEVARVRPFFRRPEGERWNLLAMHVLRFLGVLRTVEGPTARRTVAPLVVGLLRGPYRRAREADDGEGTDAGYVLLEALRP